MARDVALSRARMDAWKRISKNRDVKEIFNVAYNMGYKFGRKRERRMNWKFLERHYKSGFITKYGKEKKNKDSGD